MRLVEVGYRVPGRRVSYRLGANTVEVGLELSPSQPQRP